MTMNGSTIPFPNELTTPPASTSQTGRGRLGSRLLRYRRTALVLPAPDYATTRGARGPDTDRQAGRDVRDLERIVRRVGDRRRRAPARRARRRGRGLADRALRRGRRVRRRVPGGMRRRARRRPVLARRDRGPPARARAHTGGAGRARWGAARPLREARRPPGLAAARPAQGRAANLLDGLAWRPRRHGPAGREGGAAVPAPEAEARRRRRPRRRARARGARGDRCPAPG